MNDFVLYPFALLFPFLLGALLAPFVYRYAGRKLADKPDGSLKKHRKSVPLIGGVLIFVSVFTTLSIIRFTTDFPTGTLHYLRGVFIGGVLIFALGLADDLTKPKGVCVALKLLVQAASALALMAYGVHVQFVQNSFLSYAITFLWVVGLTNAFNLLDIMDGLCISQAVVCALGLLIIALPQEFIYVNVGALALLGACFAVWPLNARKKHKIFLGDSGSTFLGFMVASLSMGTAYSAHNEIGFLAPLLIFALPLFDTGFVMLARLLKKKNPLKGSADHIALRLKKRGWALRTILSVFIAAGLFFNLLAYALTIYGAPVAVCLFIVTGALLGLITLWLLSLPAD